MTDYKKLVDDLRDIGKTMFALGTTHISMDNVSISLAYDKGWGQTANDAAAAIEALQAELEKKRTADCCGCKCEKIEPKRGEWIVDGMYTYNLRELNGKAYEPVYRCSCCNRQMESYLRLDEPKMPEDADFPEYCPHCGAEMEVKDGKRCD